MKIDWKPLKEVNFADEGIKQYHIDTRDFCCVTSDKHYDDSHADIPGPDLDKLLKPKYRGRFFYTNEEVLALITRLYNESGGEKKMRVLCLEGDDSWNLKYIRLYRLKWGLIVCNSYNRAMSKDTMSKPVKKPY